MKSFVYLGILLVLLPWFAQAEEEAGEEQPRYEVQRFAVTVGREPNTFSENLYLVFNSQTKDAVIIDPGSPSEKAETFIEAADLKVRMILNTHGHYDHMGANRHYADLYEVSIVAHQEDADQYEGPAEKHKPDRFLAKEKTLEIPGFTFQVIHTPGHTPGCICFYLPGLLFSGDTLFRESIGRIWGDTPEEKQAKTKQEIDHIKRLLLVLPDETRVYPGHGPSTHIAHEKKQNPFLQ